MELAYDQIDDLCRGAAFLGAGGGGDPYIGGLMIKRALQEGGKVEIIDPDDLDDDVLVIPTAMMGAPTVLIEKLPSGDEVLRAFAELEKHLDRKAFATMPIEVGGINSTIPMWVAARLGIPVIDADGMGRAFPEIHMETFGVHGVSGSPLAIANEHGDYAIVNAVKNQSLEWIARGIAIRFGGAAYIAEYPMSGEQVKRTSVKHTLTLAMEIGRRVELARQSGQDPFAAIIDFLPETHYSLGKILFTGKVVDVKRTTERGFTVGRVTIDGVDQGSLMIEFQNENLIARKNGQVLAIVPNIITIMDVETAEPITTEFLRYGQRVRVMAVSVPEIMTSPAALDLFGPQGFGLKEPFQPMIAD